MSDNRIQRLSVEGLRSTDPQTLPVLVAEALRLHIERVEPSCIADLFALSEVGLKGAFGAELANWARKAAREIRDLPAGDVRTAFVAEVSELEPSQVPQTMREALSALAAASSGPTLAALDAAAAVWAGTPPAPVVLPQPKPKATKAVQEATVTRATTASAAAATRTKSETPARRLAPKTPAAMVDPRRAEWVREDVMARLGSREYVERGLKENILVAGVKHRSPYKDLTDEEVRAELRRLERERKLKHTAERWLVR